ncbi:hypothetical protein BS50DRAFT_325948 [Corynespora cassiicola Philippines]|uniref:Uncharacterized protein n=1 Tax=Corynespora cassiicola Philippines TaxID=1448308 RepID=A0A2T2NTW3_CORCC|nr:hypothetical protein BS50DRAFT_325948 [Corynespora cassiicola Philippines]
MRHLWRTTGCTPHIPVNMREREREFGKIRGVGTAGCRHPSTLGSWIFSFLLQLTDRVTFRAPRSDSSRPHWRECYAYEKTRLSGHRLSIALGMPVSDVSLARGRRDVRSWERCWCQNADQISLSGSVAWTASETPRLSPPFCHFHISSSKSHFLSQDH